MNSKRRRCIVVFALCAVVSIAVSPRPAPACTSSPCVPTVGCTKSVSIVKAVPAVVLTPATPLPFAVPVRINTVTGVNPAGGCPVCPNPATVQGGTVTVSLLGPGGPFVGMAPIAIAGSGFQTQTVSVTVTIPPGTVGLFVVSVTADVNFSADSAGPPQTVTAMGDSQVCFVEETSPGSGIPRLDMQLLAPGLLQCPPGAQYNLTYRVRNNDPTESVTLMATATSGQAARMPTTTGDPDRVRSISNPVSGDDFPIAFLEDLPGGILPLPPNPPAHTQPDIMKMLTIQPGESADVIVAIRSYSQCDDGSCADSLLSVQGTFDTSGDPALACAGATLNVNSSMGAEHIPTMSEWGLIIMTLLLLTAATVIFGKIRQHRPAVT